MKKTLILALALSVVSWALPSIGKIVTISYAQEEPGPDEKPAPKPEKPKPAPKPEPKPESPENN
jgi:outer membrane biosynthesis protein TonB